MQSRTNKNDSNYDNILGFTVGYGSIFGMFSTNGYNTEDNWGTNDVWNDVGREISGAMNNYGENNK